MKCRARLEHRAAANGFQGVGALVYPERSEGLGQSQPQRRALAPGSRGFGRAFVAAPFQGGRRWVEGQGFQPCRTETRAERAFCARRGGRVPMRSFTRGKFFRLRRRN